jgi:hypothetical protein
MANSLFLWNNLIDLAATTITASTTDADFPVANLKHIWKTKHHRTTDHTAEYIDFDFGAPKKMQAFALAYHNYTVSGTPATLNLLLDGVATFDSGSLVTIPITPVSNLLCNLFSQDYTFQYARWSMADGANADGFLKTGRIFLGEKSVLSRNFDNDYARPRTDPSVLAASVGGQDSVSQKAQFRQFSYVYSNLLEADRAILEDIIFAAVGIHTPVFFVHDSTYCATKTWYVKFAGGELDIRHVFMDNNFTIAINFKEAQ